MFHVTDWLPTLVKAAGGNIPKEIDGIDQWEVLKTSKDEARSEMVYNIIKTKTMIIGGIR